MPIPSRLSRTWPFLRMVAGGMVLGSIGAAIWIQTVVHEGYEHLGIAVLLPLLSGIGARWMSYGQHGLSSGQAALIEAMTLFLFAKYWSASSFLLNKIESGGFVDIPSDEIADEMIVHFLVRQNIEERMEQGERLNWPKGHNLDNAVEPDDYPVGLWSDIKLEWALLSDDQKNEVRSGIQSLIASGNRFARGWGQYMAFLHAFSEHDILWILTIAGISFAVGFIRWSAFLGY